MATEERREEPAKECVYRTKVIQFLGRTTPIILQNDNGPCPLLAICNVLLLKNNLNLSSDTAEVSQEKLLSLVAERLIDSNSNVNNKDAGYIENQQQNIADAIDLLPRLATGIDVNLKFRRIDDFEFTRECAIFDLLDIPLYHGWIVDPQDFETANAIGSKSYNALTGELVALLSQNNIKRECKNNPVEDCVDFAAATTATFGVPSPCLSRGRSFDDSPRSVSDQQKVRKGDVEEEEQLLKALKLSKAESPTPVDDTLTIDTNGGTMPVNSDESAYYKECTPLHSLDRTEGCIGGEKKIFHQPEPSIVDDVNVLGSGNKELTSFGTIPGEVVCSTSKTEGGNHINQPTSVDSGECFPFNNVVEKTSVDTSVQNETRECFPRNDVVESSSVVTVVQNESAASMVVNHINVSGGDEQVQDQSTSASDVNELTDNQSGFHTAELSSLSPLNADSDSSSGRSHHGPDAFASSVDGSEPIYEGEECILESGMANYEDREPMYEGEVVLAEQADKGTIDAYNVSSMDEITPQQGELIRNFLKNNASQLTIYGLFCLQDGLKERELCVFFRNNHFCTMFKFEDDLYLLATDQGYINQPDLVWEKLNEVNGDTLFMTGNFKEFKVEESHANESWNEQNAMASTADYLASIDNAAQASSNINSDLQLAIALQQQEFEQQPQRQNFQQPSISGSSRLVTGPQVPKNIGKNSTSSSSSRHEAKSKEKCIVM
ncbi:hypothetical protein L1049_006831 [Liquidambar formosana]|uniref:MINDY deubiquitinase domain-containing protein n=1 Tax=Liquidambar formosana TaxID=63359 RepID=A0AAP0RJF4_LIQFO